MTDIKEKIKNIKAEDIEFAGDDILNQYPDKVKEVMDVIYPNYLFISDMSCVGDFPVDDDDLKEFSDKFEMIVESGTYIYEVVKHLATRKPS